MTRAGRPTDDPKKYQFRTRLSEGDKKKLEYCCEVLGLTKSEVVRQGIDKMYEKARSQK
jgi:predicted DNA-binding protein